MPSFSAAIRRAHSTSERFRSERLYQTIVSAEPMAEPKAAIAAA